MPVPITTENVAFLFLDLQTEIVAHARTQTADKLKLSVGALAKLAAQQGIPVFLSTIPNAGDVLDAILTPLGKPTVYVRTATCAFDEPGFVAAVKASKRQVLVLGGVTTEIVVVRTALAALAAGYDVYVAVDACGGISPRTEDATWRHIVAAGGATCAAVTVVADLAGSFTEPKGQAALGLIYELLGG